MKNMPRHIPGAMVSMLVLLSVIALGARSFQPAGQAEVGKSEQTTIAGCVQMDAERNQFVLLADDKATYHIQAAEGVDVASHANHRVELTGTVEKNEQSNVLKVTALKMVASTCDTQL
jgi:hypothetical protein